MIGYDTLRLVDGLLSSWAVFLLVFGLTAHWQGVDARSKRIGLAFAPFLLAFTGYQWDGLLSDSPPPIHGSAPYVFAVCLVILNLAILWRFNDPNVLDE